MYHNKQLEESDRIETLKAVILNLQSTLESVRLGQHVLEHAEHLERQASELLQKAANMRTTLANNRENQHELKLQLIFSQVECWLLRHLQRCGLTLQGDKLKNMVREMMQERIDRLGLDQAITEFQNEEEPETRQLNNPVTRKALRA